MFHASAAALTSGELRLCLGPGRKDSSDAVEDIDIVESRFETCGVKGEGPRELDGLVLFLRL